MKQSLTQLLIRPIVKDETIATEGKEEEKVVTERHDVSDVDDEYESLFDNMQVIRDCDDEIDEVSTIKNENVRGDAAKMTMMMKKKRKLERRKRKQQENARPDDDSNNCNGSVKSNKRTRSKDVKVKREETRGRP